VKVDAGTIRVLLFGPLRAQLGGEMAMPSEPGETLAGLWARITAGHPQVRRDGVRAARNLAYCSWDEVVGAGDEIAFLPPVAGGSVDR
jgi:molybdopterin converting factor small subunit